MGPSLETGELQNLTCKDCKELTEIKDSGIKIYRYEINSKNAMEEPGTNNTGKVEVTKNIFIVINSSKLPDLSLFLEDVSHRIKCKRCQYIAKRAEKYLERDRRVEKDDIASICDHCRRKLHPCDDIRAVCDQIIKKYFTDKFHEEKNKDFAPKTKLWPRGHHFGVGVPEIEYKKKVREQLKKKPTGVADEIKVLRGPTMTSFDSSESLSEFFPMSDYLTMNKLIFPKDKTAARKQKPWVTTTSAEIIEGIRERDLIRSKEKYKSDEERGRYKQGKKHRLSADDIDWESEEQKNKYREKRGKYPDREMMSRSSETYRQDRIKDTKGTKSRSSYEIQRAGKAKKMRRESSMQQSDEYIMRKGGREQKIDSKGRILPVDKQYKQGKDIKPGESQMARDDGKREGKKMRGEFEMQQQDEYMQKGGIEPKRDSKGRLLPADKHYKLGKETKPGDSQMARDDGKREGKKMRGEFDMQRKEEYMQKRGIEPKRDSKGRLLPADKQYKQGKDMKPGEALSQSEKRKLPYPYSDETQKKIKLSGDEKKMKDVQENQLGKDQQSLRHSKQSIRDRDERMKKGDKDKQQKLQDILDSMEKKSEAQGHGTRKKEKSKKDKEEEEDASTKKDGTQKKDKIGKEKLKGKDLASDKESKTKKTDDLITRAMAGKTKHRDEVKVIVVADTKRTKLPKKVKTGKSDREDYDEMIKQERGVKLKKEVEIVAQEVAKPSLLKEHMKGVEKSQKAGQKDAAALARAELEIKVNQIVMETMGKDLQYALPNQKKVGVARPGELPDIPQKHNIFQIHTDKDNQDQTDTKNVNDKSQRLLQSIMTDHKKHLDSETELHIESLLNMINKKKRSGKMIKNTAIVDYNPAHYMTEKPPVLPFLFRSSFTKFPSIDTSIKTQPSVADASKLAFNVDDDSRRVMRYALSDRTFIDKGWTQLPTEKVLRKMNIYRMRPSHPEFDWIKHNKSKGLMQYDTGERLAEFENDGHARCYYRNGRIALNYYDAEEANAKQRYVVYSDGEPDSWGRPQPVTVLAMFDYSGNGIVFDHSGKTRLKYNQTEGVVVDPSLGSTQWKWHSLNDPPILQQVMIDTHMPHKDPDIVKLGEALGEFKVERPNDDQMLAIELENFVKEKSKKLDVKFTPYQVKMKALKINNQFSLKILDQRTIYLLFQDGKTHITLNLGMILDNKEIVDTETVELGVVANTLERFPAKTDSIEDLQKGLENTRKLEKMRLEKENRLHPPVSRTVESSDQLAAALSRPLHTLGKIHALSPWNTQCQHSTCKFG